MIYFCMPLQTTYITQEYGVNVDYYGPGGHEGVDFRAKSGTPVFSVSSGTVRRIKRDYSHPYGIFIEIEHDNDFYTIYAHLSEIKVSAGENIKECDVIGLSGNTGNSTAPHLHFSLTHKNKYVDPLKGVQWHGTSR